MRVSITGGLGFIGLGIGKALSATGHDVLLSDIHRYSKAAGMAYAQADVLNAEDCKQVCAGQDIVFHSAAMHDAKEVAKKPLYAVELNVTGTLNLLRAAIDAGVKRFICISSAKVYGSPEKLPSVETDLPVPRETYALSKVMSEYYCQQMHEQSDLEITIIRPFSVYGPGQILSSGYIGMIISAILNQTEPCLPGRPEFVRDFVHIDDVTQLCARAAMANQSGVTVLNAGSGQPTSLHDLLALATEIYGKDLGGQYLTPGPGTLIRMQACMKKAEAALGFRPAYDLRTGLAETFDWFIENQPATSQVAEK